MKTKAQPLVRILEQDGSERFMVPVEEIRPNPNQPRKFFKPSALKSLARSIERGKQIMPILLKRLPEGDTHKYEIIDGERRWRACGIGDIPLIWASITDEQMSGQEQHMQSLEANLHREPHSHIEIAIALKVQVDGGESRLQIAERLSKSVGWVGNYLKIMDLIPELQDKMHPDTPEDQFLRFQVALFIARLPKERQMAGYKLAISGEQSLPQRADSVAKFVESVAGPGKRGRPHDTKKRVAGFLYRIEANTVVISDLNQGKFNSAIRSFSVKEQTKFRQAIVTLHEKLGELIQNVDHPLNIE